MSDDDSRGINDWREGQAAAVHPTHAPRPASRLQRGRQQERLKRTHLCGNDELTKLKNLEAYEVVLYSELPPPFVTEPPSRAAVIGLPARSRPTTRSMRRPLP